MLSLAGSLRVLSPLSRTFFSQTLAPFSLNLTPLPLGSDLLPQPSLKIRLGAPVIFSCTSDWLKPLVRVLTKPNMPHVPLANGSFLGGKKDKQGKNQSAPIF